MSEIPEKYRSVVSPYFDLDTANGIFDGADEVVLTICKRKPNK